MKQKRWVRVSLMVLAALVLIGILAYALRGTIVSRFFSPTDSLVKTEQAKSLPIVVASGLATPWSISFLPNGDMLVTEREGKLTRIGKDRVSTPIEGVKETSEGGLLGVALDPDFAQNSYLYMYYTTEDDGKLTNRVDRYVLRGDSVGDDTAIIKNIPAASNHNGGAIAFGPDKKLYITTGDAGQSDSAQDNQSLAGKLLRINSDGSVPSDNPFGNAVWSYGHRNPQGIAWDSTGQLWSVEHGPSGTKTGRDELNRIEKGANYGWPVITGDERREGMMPPVAQSGDNDTWAPSGMAYMNGSLYFAGLRGQTLYRAEIADDNHSVMLSKYFSETYGRMRAVTEHGGQLYFSTSNRDGRGSPQNDDDKVLRWRP